MFRFPQVPPGVLLFCLRTAPRAVCCVPFFGLIGLLLAVMVSQTFLAFHDLGSLERHCSEILLGVLCWDPSRVFLMMRSGYVCWQEDHGGKVLFQHIILEAQPVTMMHTLTWVTWLHFACQLFFLPLSPCFPDSILQREVTQCSPLFGAALSCLLG